MFASIAVTKQKSGLMMVGHQQRLFNWLEMEETGRAELLPILEEICPSILRGVRAVTIGKI